MRPTLALGGLAVALLVSTADAKRRPPPPPTSAAAPDWTDVPRAIAATMGPVEPALRACQPRLPMHLGVIVRRDRGGATVVSLPLLGLGHRGPTPLERCLARAVATAQAPALPVGLEHLGFSYRLDVAPSVLVALAPAMAAWRDPLAVIDGGFGVRRAALGVCAGAPRTVQLVLERRGGATRVRLPAWQFHTPGGDGSTPPRQRAIKTCMTKALRGWRLPTLPVDFGDLHVAVDVTP